MQDGGNLWSRVFNCKDYNGTLFMLCSLSTLEIATKVSFWGAIWHFMMALSCQIYKKYTDIKISIQMSFLTALINCRRIGATLVLPMRKCNFPYCSHCCCFFLFMNRVFDLADSNGMLSFLVQCHFCRVSDSFIKFI